MYNCAKCFQRGCTKQDMTKTLPDCPSKDEQVKEQAKQLYNEPENHRIAYCAALTEAGGYCQDTRLIEIIKFLHRGGYHKIGIAFCTGLFKETQEVVNILEYNGFEVVSIFCKNGSITKDFLGITDEQAVRGSCKTETMCNPIGQALFLNQQKTDFNLMLGLCVGHDTLFIKYSDAPITASKTGSPDTIRWLRFIWHRDIITTNSIRRTKSSSTRTTPSTTRSKVLRTTAPF